MGVLSSLPRRMIGRHDDNYLALCRFGWGRSWSGRQTGRWAWTARRTGPAFCRWASSSASPSPGTASSSRSPTLHTSVSLVLRVDSACRVLLSKPKLVLMDESTSALDTDNERLLYEALVAAGITFVSVGHRPTLVDYHQLVLRLKPSDAATAGANWELLPARSLNPVEIS